MKKLITIMLIFAVFAAQTIKQLRKDMYGIASYAMEGRFTGSPRYLNVILITLQDIEGLNRQHND